MVSLVDKMPRTIRESVMVREQLGLALNRLGRADEADSVLQKLMVAWGPSSESYGILGRIYKDRWNRESLRGASEVARSFLWKAIEAYRLGFDLDWRNAYPGINAVTLMELADPPDPRARDLLPVVRFAVQQRLASGRADYWDFATHLELAVLGYDYAEAEKTLVRALEHASEAWQLQSTHYNLRLILDARAKRGQADDVAEQIARRFVTQANT
jgi:tetratricopeptide (TPR) repeat protein